MPGRWPMTWPGMVTNSKLKMKKEKQHVQLNKYSFGVGDRFAHQARAQLSALQKAARAGVEITPVWNKSFREHKIIGSDPCVTRQKADEAVRDLSWKEAYFVDADHINLDNVDFFMDSCDFFTIDVADYIGKPAAPETVDRFVQSCAALTGRHKLPLLDAAMEISEELIRATAQKYLFAAGEAGKIYRHIKEEKGSRAFIAEVSMDETDDPQSPVELFVILAALSFYGVELHTLAPKFSGRFNKGVDYAGDLSRFAEEFERDLAVIRLAGEYFDLPATLKLSVHSGSDKFSLYPVIRQAIRKFDAGIHVKTAGTTWLEELIGLAEAGGDGLEMAVEIYRRALEAFEDLCAPYATVIDIDPQKLPAMEEVRKWDGSRFARALRHHPGDSLYNPHFRQLLHVGYKIAANMGQRYLHMLEKHETVVAGNVTANIFERHIRPLFLD